MIAIKGMEEMPKSCADCERGSICGYGLGYRPDICPLVEIVTCKDCKHHNNHNLGCDINGYEFCDDDYYCGDAERRE